MYVCVCVCMYVCMYVRVRVGHSNLVPKSDYPFVTSQLVSIRNNVIRTLSRNRKWMFFKRFTKIIHVFLALIPATCIAYRNVPALTIVTVLLGDDINTEVRLCKIWRSYSGGYEEFCLLGHNVMPLVESQLTFRRNMSPPFSRPKKQETSMKQVISLVTCYMIVCCNNHFALNG
jgi:hypothetical protein